MAEQSAPAPICQVWSDHVWGEPRVILSGRHPQRGQYHVFKTVCERCHRSLTETRWLSEPTTVLNPGSR